MLEMYVKNLWITNTSSVSDAFERAAGSSERSSWLPGCSVLEDESNGVRNNCFRSTAKLTVSTPRKKAESRVCRGISSNWATLFRTRTIPKANPAYHFLKLNPLKDFKAPTRATFSAGQPSCSVSMVSQNQRSSQLKQWGTQGLTAYQAIWKERKAVCASLNFQCASPNFQCLAPCLANWLPSAPSVRQVPPRDWSSTGIIQELQLSLSRDPFDPNSLGAQRH